MAKEHADQADSGSEGVPGAPTDEQMAEYRRLLQKVRDANNAGTPDPEAEKQLDDFVQKSGIANEAPAEDFPELDDKNKP